MAAKPTTDKPSGQLDYREASTSEADEAGRRLSTTTGRRIAVVDDVFGSIVEGGPDYRSVGWKRASALMMKTQIGLGVLSIPQVFDVLGMVPGVICLILVAIITTWSDYMIGVFKLRHRQVYGIDDAGALMFGRVGREIFGAGFVLFWVFVAGAGMLGVSIGLNAISMHGTCTAVFVVVAAIVGCCLASIQTLSKISWLAWLGLFCILSAIFTCTVAVGVQDRPAAAPQDVPFVSNYKLFNSPSIVDALSACSSLVFAFAGTPAFFSIVSEMRHPQHYTRSLLVCQSTVTSTYLIIGIVVYYYVGSFVASPALGSAGVLLKKICYGLALPGLIVTTVLTIHLPAKYIFIRTLRGSHHLAENTLKHYVVWFSCTFGVGAVAYVIASAIPVFGGLVSLIGALLGTMMSFQPMGCMWLYDNWGEFRRERTWRLTFMVVWSVFVVVSGTFLMIGGTYGSVVGVMNEYRNVGGSAAWSCADNSNSV